MKKLLIVCTLFAVACEEPTAAEREQTARAVARYVVKYLHDDRTEMCFAYHDGPGGIAIAVVPCTEEVLREAHR